MENVTVPRHTKIVATIGPASAPSAILRDLLTAGVDVFRLNFSHGSHESHAAVFQKIRQAAADTGRTAAVMQDLSGPKIRTGPLEGGEVTLTPGRNGRIAHAAWVDPVSVRNRLHTGLAEADIAPGSGVWVSPRLVVQRASQHPDTHEPRPFRTIDVGLLRRGNAPRAGGGDDRVLVADRGTTVELRIPWALLTFADPSSHRLWQVVEGGDPSTRKSAGIGISVAPAGKSAAAARRYTWAGWNRVRWHERRKAGWPTVRRAMLQSAAR